MTDDQGDRIICLGLAYSATWFAVCFLVLTALNSGRQAILPALGVVWSVGWAWHFFGRAARLAAKGPTDG